MMNEMVQRYLILLLAMTLAGCAAAPRTIQQPPEDRLEGFNRAMYRFNDRVDRAVLRPVAQGYRSAVPRGMRYVIGNFFEHWTYPPVILNDLLQGKLGQAGRDTARFALNTVMGLGGLFDVAEENGLPANDEDFGQTLAVWGVPSGPYLVLPLLGPSTVRDTVSRPVDAAASPYVHYVDEESLHELNVLYAIDIREGLLEVDDQLRDAYDPYLFLRDAWIQRRNYEIHDGDPPLQDPADDESWDYEIDVD